ATKRSGSPASRSGTSGRWRPRRGRSATSGPRPCWSREAISKAPSSTCSSTASGWSTSEADDTERRSTARGARSRPRPRRTSPLDTRSSNPSDGPAGRSPRGSVPRTGPATASRLSIPKSPVVDRKDLSFVCGPSFGAGTLSRRRSSPQTFKSADQTQRDWVVCLSSPPRRAGALAPRPDGRGSVGSDGSWRRGRRRVEGMAMETRGPSPRSGSADAMRIALFTDSYLPTVDGVVTSVLSTRRQLEAHGPELVVFAPEDPRRRGRREPAAIYVRAKELPHYPRYQLAMSPAPETDLIK